MNDLEKRIQETVARKMNDGTIEKMIEEQMEKAIKTALDDVFGYSGNGRKLLKEKFDEVMCPAIENHDFNKYVTKLDSVLTEIVNNTRFTENKQILDNFSYLMKDNDFREIKLSDIFKFYCECVGKDVNTDDLEVYTDDEPSYQNVTATMEITSEVGYFTNHIDVMFSCEQDEKLETGIELYDSSYGGEKKYHILAIGDSTGNKNIDITSLRYMSKFEVFLRNIESCFVNIIIDCGDMCEEVEVEAEPEASWS